MPAMISERQLQIMLSTIFLGAVANAQEAPILPQLHSATVVTQYPHDPSAFTEGLTFVDGHFLESTGERGRSTVRTTDPATGQVLDSRALPFFDFGEGVTQFNNRIYQLTWQSGKTYVYPSSNLADRTVTTTPLGDGWGLTHNQQSLIVSNGTSALSWLDPTSLALQRSVQVTDSCGADTKCRVPIPQLNELEWINGEIWANIWQTDCIAVIGPAHGHVRTWIHLPELKQAVLALNDQQVYAPDVLNGIAYDAATDRIFVTGKNWPRVYEIKPLVQAEAPSMDQLAAVHASCIRSGPT